MVNYDVQDKLVNFMAPDDRPVPCEWNLNELFRNLFADSKQPKLKSGAYTYVLGERGGGKILHTPILS